MHFRYLVPCIAACVAYPLTAGEQVLYEPTPAWVEPASTPIDPKSTSPLVRLRQSVRIEDGEVWTYVETVYALSSPEALTQFGTVGAAWLPDKGDLRIHSVELLRKGQTIDLLANGDKFEVIRREMGLERRMLDGVLTATMPISGAQLGDQLRMTYSVSLRDQAMAGDAQWQVSLPAKPLPLDGGDVSVSWPKDMTVSRVKIGAAPMAEPVLRNGYYHWGVSLPVPEEAEQPGDAPLRYALGEIVQVSTYPDWQAVSRNMSIHYDVTGKVTQGGALAQKIAAIAGTTDNRLERTALALQSVQDDISYLLNGLDGGNYLPQSPEETWAKRFGDCKAKSVLLLAMLRGLGVDAEVVLVRSAGGDALPLLAPMPGNFDHMIVRAEIDGTTYWLDGTVAGSRIDTIDTVPRFHYALPLRAGGAELVPLGERPQATPDRIARVTLDHSAGIRVPALVDVEVELRGQTAALWRTIAEQDESTAQRDAVRGQIGEVIGDLVLSDHSIAYDNATGIARITGRGVLSSKWEKDRAAYKFEAPQQVAKDVDFDIDRARAAWRDIPVRLNGPVYRQSEFEMILPAETAGFSVDGSSELDETIGGVELRSQARLDGNRFILSQSMRSTRDELAAPDVTATRRAMTRFGRLLPKVKAPATIREVWQYSGKDRALLKPIETAYAKAIALADPDDTYPLILRAGFRLSVYDFEGGLADINRALAIEESGDLYSARSGVRHNLGDLAGALEDLQRSEDLAANGYTYDSQIELLALLGRTDEALAVAEEYSGLGESAADEAMLMAAALGWASRIDEALALLADELDRRPGDGPLLNTICWQAGIWNAMDEERLSQCTQAVEKSDYSVVALDSRALAHFRMGNNAAALADLNAVLLEEPTMAESRLLRGIVRLADGDRGGREDIDTALRMQPSLRQTYTAWGLKF
jgi:tetratricopeptide (TPR) repeat protein